MVYQYIEYSSADRITIITLNRPDKRNAFNFDFITELKEAFSVAENDKSVKVIILKANGAVFSAGADLEYLKSIQDNSYDDNLLDSIHLMELYKLIYFHSKLVIAQVEGHAIAGGCGFVTVCDFSFSSPEAKFGYTEVKLGFIPAIVSVFLLRKIGEARSKELLLTGKLIDAAEAQSIGLINYVHPKDDLNEIVEQFATRLSEETSGESIGRTKRLIGQIQQMKTEEALQFAAEMNAKARETKDFKDGITAFLNKEQKSW